MPLDSNGKHYEWIFFDEVIPPGDRFGPVRRHQAKAIEMVLSENGMYVPAGLGKPGCDGEPVLRAYMEEDTKATSDWMDLFRYHFDGDSRFWRVRTGSWNDPGEAPRFQPPEKREPQKPGHGDHKTKQKNRAARKAAEKARRKNR